MAEVLVAMSGGVDSAVAAALLAEQGHDVTAVHLKLAVLPLAAQIPGQGCCTLDDAQDARRAAQVIGVPFYVWNLSEVFEAEVQTPFAAAYAAGLTPNPCITCNERVKYAALMRRAVALGLDAIAPRHHARLRRDGEVVREPGPGVALHRAADPAKDQSYVLHVATPQQLARTLLPVGELTKGEVRRLAAARGLRVAAKRDSYDVCFVPDGDTAGYLASRLPPAPGPLVDLDGEVVGHHDGVWRFTVGQRRGLGLDPPPGTAGAGRRYVVDVDAASRTVTTGARGALACSWIEVDAPNWILGPPADGPVRVQVRAHGRSVPATVGPAGAGVQGVDRSVRIELEEPLHGVARGQAAVVYDRTDSVCLGGGTIVRAERPAPVHARPVGARR